jgi:hypothetical protein
MQRADEVRSYMPIELDYLRYRWVADLTRMREELGFAPRLTAEEAVRTLVQPLDVAAEADGAGLSAERLLNTIEARRRRASTAVAHEDSSNE